MGSLGCHGCCIVARNGSAEATTARILRQALRADSPVIWTFFRTGGESLESIDSLLGAEERACLETGQLKMIPLPAASSSADELNPQAALARVRTAIQSCQAAGGTEIWLVQDMHSAAVRAEDSTLLEEYEEGLSALLENLPVKAVCIYEEAEAAPGTLLELVDLHPHWMPGDRFLPNPWFGLAPPSDSGPAAEVLGSRMELLLQLARVDEALHRQATLTSLMTVVGNADGGADRIETLSIVVREICQSMGWPAGEAFLPEDDGLHLAPADICHHAPQGQVGLDDMDYPVPRARKGEGLLGRAWTTGRSSWERPVSGPRAGRCAVALPIRVRGELFAVLRFHSADPGHPDEDLLSALDVVGNRVGEIIRRQRAEEDLARSERRLRAVITSAAHGIVIANASGMILSWNPAGAALFGRPGERAPSVGLTDLFSSKGQGELARAIQEVMDDPGVDGTTRTLNLDGLSRDRRETPMEVTLARWETGGRSYLTAAVRDLTEKVLLEEALRRADRDSLTGLPTRDLLLKRLRRSMERGAQRPNYRYALLLLDLDGFDQINKTLGHLTGDRFLIAVAQRLESSVRPGDTVARSGGDEFAVLLEYVEKIQDVILVTERILTELGRSFQVGDHEILTSVSVGIALSDSAYHDPETMLREADAAMARARRVRQPYEIADTELYADALALFRLETDLRTSLKAEQFLIHYQPLVSVDSGRIVGFEALARWDHPERGIVGPDQFIPVLEATGMILELGRWVRREACAQLARWQRDYPSSPPLMLSVNVSPVELEDPGFVEGVGQMLAQAGLDPASLHLEITESVFMNRPERVLGVLAALREMGAQVWIDDFGTGYSSLGYLHHFPVGLLKIDRLFVGRIDETRVNRSIVRTILDLASNLGIGALAEGVETPTQLDRLKELSCTYAQGFLFSEPVAGGAAERLLAGQEREPSEVPA